MRWVRRWRDVSIARKLYFVVGIMALLIVGELVTLRFAMHILSAARAFVGGEGLWSKSQKNAAIAIQRYGLTRDEADFTSFIANLQVPEQDHLARLELFKPEPDLARVRSGFLGGRLHPDDIDPMIELLRRFYWTPHLSHAIAIWGAADERVAEFKAAGLAYHAAVIGKDSVAAGRGLADIKRLNDSLTALEDEFSYVLGAGSRWIETVVLTLLSTAVLAVESVGLTLTFLTSRSISRGLKELNETATQIGRGDLSKTVTPRSGDELGQLARSVNQMGWMLGRSYAELETRVKQRTSELARSRDELDGIVRGLRFLDKANQILTSSMSYRETLPQVAELAVPSLADGCTIDLPAGDGRSEGLVIARGRERGGATMAVAVPTRGGVAGSLTFALADGRRSHTGADQRIAEELAQRVGNAVENATLYELAQRAIREREEFLSIVSHELNTPLTSLRLQIQMAQQRIERTAGSGGSDKTLAAVARALQVSETQILRLTRLVDDLLDVACIRAGKLRFTFARLSLSDLVHDVVTRFEDQFSRVGSVVTAELEEDVVGSFDQLRIEQLVDNLLTNALKYAPGKPVRVSLASANRVATLMVEDQGPGIAEDKQATIFNRFERGASNPVGGLGLGLFIAKEIVVGQRGSIQVQSRVGEGARFIVDLPLLRQ